MGLDMGAHATRFSPDKPVAFTVPEGAEVRELAYWRKHPNLHGWMQRLAVEKGFSADPSDFNCVPLLLTSEDIDRLEKDVLSDNLPATSGFFFGASSPEDKADDLTFIGLAREVIAEGLNVFYDSWW